MAHSDPFRTDTYRNYSFFLVYFIQYYAGNQGLVERPPKRSRPSLYMDHVNMAYVVQRIRKGYFSLDQGRASKTLDQKPFIILNIKYINIIMSRTHRVSLIPNGHSVWTIQIEYGISTILYGSYRPVILIARFCV